jgi:toxin ParE1/3/4
VKRYLVTYDANLDLAEIQNYLANEAGVSVARYVLKSIKEALSFLGQTPNAGHDRKDLTLSPVKFWPVFSYLVIYDPKPRPINIVRVLHSGRDIPNLLSDPN